MNKEKKMSIRVCSKCGDRFFGSIDECFPCRSGTEKRKTKLSCLAKIKGI